MAEAAALFMLMLAGPVARAAEALLSPSCHLDGRAVTLTLPPRHCGGTHSQLFSPRPKDYQFWWRAFHRGMG